MDCSLRGGGAAGLDCASDAGASRAELARRRGNSNGGVLLHAHHSGVFAGAGTDFSGPVLRAAGAVLGAGQAAASRRNDGADDDGEAAVRPAAAVDSPWVSLLRPALC